MKRVVYLSLLVVLASCSSNKYAAHFQRSDGNYGYGEVSDKPKGAPTPAVPLPMPTNLVVSTEKTSGIITEPNAVAQAAALEDIRHKYAQLSSAEKKTFKKELSREMKKIAKAKSKGEQYVPGVTKTQAMDHDLRLAAIFGSVGVVALLISGQAFYIIGAIALIIGVVFFVMWLTRQ